MQRPKPFKSIRKFVHRPPTIKEVLREPTAGGIIYRHGQSAKGELAIEILLIQDAKGRYTIPKGHIEEGETARQTAEREIKEEVGLAKMRVGDFLGKINFRYRRDNSLVLMTTEVYLVEAQGNTNDVRPEEWMTGLSWMPVNEALEKIEYDDIGKLILLGMQKIRKNGR